eukprot:5466091-Pleurochrysis_carterae.AAC.2
MRAIARASRRERMIARVDRSLVAWGAKEARRCTSPGALARCRLAKSSAIGDATMTTQTRRLSRVEAA